MKKILLSCAILLATTTIYGQLNAYKYVVVPIQFNEFSNANQYNTSTLIKHLFVQDGFTAYYDNSDFLKLEEEVCDGLFVDLINQSGMFVTKVVLRLKDCKGVK